MGIDLAHSSQEIFLDIMLHLGTLIAVLIFFRKEIGAIVKALAKELNTVVKEYYNNNNSGNINSEVEFYTLTLSSLIGNRLEEKGVKIVPVMLHVGLGTFRPVKAEKIEDHQMHSEHYHLPKETADLINATKKNGGRVIAVGTTSCRTLESVGTFCGEIREDDRNTDIFIYPGYKFKCIDGLLTNFHLPESTLIMLVSAFYGYDKTLSAYKTAVDEKYRFFSFGDCMLIC